MGIKPEAIRRLVALTRNTETTFFNLSRREAKKFSLLKSLLKKNFEPAELVYQFNKEIAQSLTISVETVKEHVQNILRKLAVSDRTQAAVWAVRRGLA